jgi:hypothetical protein
MVIFLPLSVVDPAIAGLKEGKKCRERAFLTLPPDSDRNEGFLRKSHPSCQARDLRVRRRRFIGLSALHTMP